MGAAIGFHAAQAWQSGRMGALKLTHKKEMDELFVEVKRLRVLVANIIGKEKQK